MDEYEKRFSEYYSVDWYLKIKNEDPPMWRVGLSFVTVFYLYFVYAASGYTSDGMVINTLRGVGLIASFYLLWEVQTLVGRLNRTRNELWIAASYIKALGEIKALEEKRNL